MLRTAIIVRVGRGLMLLLALAASLSPAAAQTSRADIEAIVADYLAKNPAAVERIVKNYIEKNPDALQGSIEEYVKRRNTVQQAKSDTDKAAVIKANSDLLFSSPRQVTLGNPAGDVTLVEFFDYNCGFCKRAANDKLALLKGDPRLKVVLKELPVLGPGSREAAQVAVAVRMQDAGAKYLVFHQAMMASRGPANRTTALKAAGEAGFDVARIERDLDSAEVKATLEETQRLAGQLGINGTPSYVVGQQVVVGAVGLAALGERIKLARR